jgi:hypothetical protein
MATSTTSETDSAYIGWDRDSLDYQLFLFRVLQAARGLFGGDKMVVLGSVAASTYLRVPEQRLVTGIDIALPPPLALPLIHDAFSLSTALNSKLKDVSGRSRLASNGFSIELGVFEPVRGNVNGRARLVSIVKGGHSTLRSCGKIASQLGSRVSLLEGDSATAKARYSPMFFDVRVWSNGQPDRSSWLISKFLPHGASYSNASSKMNGLGSLEINVPPLEYIVASKLNMIYQSGVNERLIRATPLSGHLAAKSSRMRILPTDIYDFVILSRGANALTVRRLLEQIASEPVNALLDLTSEAFKKISATKLFAELNDFLPSRSAFNQKMWADTCDSAISYVKKIRAT